jgi:hypothetical protein
MSLRGLLALVTILGLGGAAALGLAEAGLRVLGLAATDGVFTVTEAEFSRIPGIYAPNQRVVDRPNSPVAYLVETDSLGYRNPPLPRRKEPGEYRIFFTGDSFVYGHGVGNAETITAQLEGSLRAHCPGVRVVNGGLHGSSITSQIEMIRRAEALDPDMVIVMFFENDVQDVPQYLWGMLARNRAAKSGILLGTVYPVLRRTALWNLALDASAGYRIRTAMAANTNDSDSAADRRAENRRVYRDTLAAVRDLLRERETSFVFVTFPHHATVYEPEAPSEHAWSLATARELEIPLVDALVPLRASGLPDTTLYLLPHDAHASAEGNRLAAAYVAAQMLERGLLDGACSG